MSEIQTTPEHQAIFQALKDAVYPLMEKGNITPIEIVAIASQFTGSLLILLDHREFTASTLRDTVMGNINRGHASAIQTLQMMVAEPKGSA